MKQSVVLYEKQQQTVLKNLCKGINSLVRKTTDCLGRRNVRLLTHRFSGQNGLAHVISKKLFTAVVVPNLLVRIIFMKDSGRFSATNTAKGGFRANEYRNTSGASAIFLS